MTLKTSNIPGETSGSRPAARATASTAAAAAALQPAVLEELAGRLRPAGLMLALRAADGTVTWHDPAAAPFFQRYALPLLQQQQQQQQQQTSPATNADTVTPELPGLVFAAVPHVERRQVAGVLLLAARAGSFDLTEDVLRACSRLRLDSTWLGGAAQYLPGHAAESMPHHGRLLAAMLKDQLRAAGLERELDSLSGQLSNTYEELSLIYQVSSGMKVNRRAADFFRQACLDVLEVMSVRGMGVALDLGDDADLDHCPEPVLYGRMTLAPELVRRLADDVLPALRRRKSPLLVNKLAEHKQLAWLAEGGHARHLLAVPLQRQDQVLGCLFALDKDDGRLNDDGPESGFDSVDSKLLTSIANETAIYLENATLFDDVHGLMMGLLHSLTSAVDAKDAYTCGHSERVALLSRHLAQQLGLSDLQVERVYMAGLLHDVGKIGVPEAVLQKTGRLTPEEFDQIKKHPAIGARILQDIKQVREIVPGVLHHHERYDGKGYPAGLSGQNIPLLGRVICLADCFDAMTSSRTYRKALPLEVALTEIRRCSGTQFDPALAEVFLRTGAEGFRELLCDHQSKAKQLRELQDTLRAI